MMELQKIKKLCENRKGGLRGLAAATGMTEQNLHRCIRQQKIQAQDLYKISQELGVSIGYFFDDEIIVEEYHAHGEKGMAVKTIGKVDQRTMPICMDSIGKDKPAEKKESTDNKEVVEREESREELKAQISKLKSDLLDAQAKIIALMENRK